MPELRVPDSVAEFFGFRPRRPVDDFPAENRAIDDWPTNQPACYSYIGYEHLTYFENTWCWQILQSSPIK
jgi:hypothetical protein